MKTNRIVLLAGAAAILLGANSQAMAKRKIDCSAGVKELVGIADMVEEGFSGSGKRTKYPWASSSNRPMNADYFDCLNLGVIDKTKGRYYIKSKAEKLGKHQIYHYCLDHAVDNLCPLESGK